MLHIEYTMHHHWVVDIPKFFLFPIAHHGILNILSWWIGSLFHIVIELSFYTISCKCSMKQYYLNRKLIFKLIFSLILILPSHFHDPIHFRTFYFSFLYIFLGPENSLAIGLNIILVSFPYLFNTSCLYPNNSMLWIYNH